MKTRGLIKEHANSVSRIVRMVDVLVVAGAAMIAFWVPTWPDALDPLRYQMATLLGCLLVATIFPMLGVYRSWRGHSRLVQARAVTAAWLAVGLALVTIAFVTKSGALISRQWSINWWLGTLIGLLALRLVVGLVLRQMRARGHNQKHVLIVGAGELGQSVARQLRTMASSGFSIAGYLDDDERLNGVHIEGVQIYGPTTDVAAVASSLLVDEVWITVPMREEVKLQGILHDLRHSTVTIRYVPDIFNLRLINHSVTEIAGLPVMNLSESPLHGANAMIKFAEDKIIAAIILILVSPLMLLIAVGVRLSSPGPVFYRQERISWNGGAFTMLKFRSMPVDAERASGPVWAKANERRATRFGSFLRRTSLDELPQFLNVLKGDMSIVGPRPERPVFVEKLKDEIPDYMKKHMVKAGITGWAQVNGWRGDTDLNARIQFDLHYIENWSVWFDLRIIFLTVFRGFAHKNAY